ncbi:MAG: hypothetical protein IJ169_06265 [Paludibacteraceae bacterium]|nr:hypothetical protein [Paludibacteraceae bacterium]
MPDFSIFNNLSIKTVFIGQGIDSLLAQINTEQDYMIALFDSEKRGVIWITDDVTAGHCVFVSDTYGVNKDKLLKVFNPNIKTLFLWHIDGVMFTKYSKCDCALLHDRLMHLIEFKANAKNESDDSIQANYEKASEQLALTFEKFEELYKNHGQDIFRVFDDIDAMIVFDRTVPQDDAYQKNIVSKFSNRTLLKLSFGNELKIE